MIAATSLYSPIPVGTLLSSLSEHQDVVSRLVQDQALSIKRPYRLVNLSRAAYYREENKLPVRDAPVVEAVNTVGAKHSRWGFWKCHGRLRLDGMRRIRVVAGLLPDEAKFSKA